ASGLKILFWLGRENGVNGSRCVRFSHTARQEHYSDKRSPMTSSSSHEVTQLLLAWGKGDENALARLIPHVEAEVHRLAQFYLSRERPGHTLQATALVNEAFLHLIDSQTVQWQNRAHFFGVTAQLMRRILVDYARRRQQQKRGGGALFVSLSEAEHVKDEHS